MQVPARGKFVLRALEAHSRDLLTSPRMSAESTATAAKDDPIEGRPGVGGAHQHPSSSSAESLPGEPRSTRRRNIALFAVVLSLIALDLWSKSAVFAWLQDPAAAAEFERNGSGEPRYPLFGTEWLGFMLNLNYGAAFGQGASAQGFLVVGRVVASIFLAFLIVRTPPRQKLYLTALVLVLSGALGNLWDNLFYEPAASLPGYVEGRKWGPVRDFIDVWFYGWEWHFPTFNVADSCITVGAILLLLSGLFAGHGDGRESEHDTVDEEREEPRSDPV